MTKAAIVVGSKVSWSWPRAWNPQDTATVTASGTVMVAEDKNGYVMVALDGHTLWLPAGLCVYVLASKLTLIA